MTCPAPTMAKRGRSGRHRFLSILNDFIVVVFALTGLLLCCHGKQIVVTVDTVSSLTAEDVKEVINASSVSETSYVVFQTHLTMSSLDLLTAAKGWLQADNITTIVDMTSDCRITALTAVTDITLLRTSLVSCRDVTRDAINVRPTLETYTNAAFSYLRLFGSCLARVVLLTEFHTDLPGFPKCYKGTAIPLLARVVGSWPLSKEQTNQTQVWLKGVASRSALHYVTVMGSSNFLNGIRELGWLHLLPPTFFRWIFVITDTPSFDCSDYPRTSPIFRHSQQALDQLPLLSSHTHDVNMYYAWKALETARKLQNGEDVAPDILGEMSVFGNLTLVVEIVGENNTIKKLGTWSEYSGLQIEDSLKGDLHDPSVVIVATLQSPPFVIRVTNENGTHYEGYAIDVLKEIAQRLHINYRFTESSDGQYGLRQPNGTWNGIIGDILAGSADMAVGALTVTAEREAVVDFTTPFYEFAGIEILVKQVQQDQNLLFFVTVFSKPMWGAWFGVLLLTGLLLAVFDYMSPFSVRNTRGGSDGGEGSGDGSDREKVTDGRDTFDLKEGLWLVTASFTLSGPESTPRTLSSRMLVAGFWFFCSIIMANYTANLAAFLTTSRLTTPINSLTDLAAQSKVRYSVVRGTTTMRYFERMARIESNFYELWKNISSNMLSTGDLAKSELAVWDYPLGDTYVKIWSDMEKSGFLDSSEDGLQKVTEENFALIDEAPYLQYAISKQCGLTTIGKQFSTKSYAFALPQGSPLTEQVSNYILKLQSETTLEKLKQKWWKKTARGCGQEDEKEGLSFHTLGGVFLLAGVGVAAGLLLCLLETAWACVSTKRRKRSGTLPPITSRTDLVQEYAMTDSYDTITPLEDVTSVQVSRF